MGISKMVSHNDRHQEKGFGLDSAMPPLTPEQTRKPLSAETIANMQHSDENDRSADADVENMDEVVQEGDPAHERTLGDRQIDVANRHAD